VGDDPASAVLPPVDVVISVLNGLPYLQQAVQSALDQIGVRTHVFVVDGGSTDGTVEAMRSWDEDRVTLICDQGFLSTCAARNLGAHVGHSPWLCFLDADDVWPARRTMELLSAIDSPATQIATGNMLTFTGNEPPGHLSVEDSDSSVPAVCIGSTVMNREVYAQVGDFDTDLVVGEFVDWMARARSLGIQEVPVSTIALYRRDHGDNTSVRHRDAYRTDVPKIVQAHLARIRASRSVSARSET